MGEGEAIMEGSLKLVKIVRDRIPELMGSSDVVYAQVSDQEKYIKELRKKLLEEAFEYLTDPGVEELADVFAVVEALATTHGYTLYELTQQADKKAQARGGFENHFGMYVHASNDGMDK
jgi:predicted house-cleaning noncanonical NTP pyrophosphatase (MazG superfamily)